MSKLQETKRLHWLRHLWAFFNAQMVKEIDLFMSLKVARTGHILHGYQELTEQTHELRTESFGRLGVCLSRLRDDLKQPVYLSEFMPSSDSSQTKAHGLAQEFKDLSQGGSDPSLNDPSPAPTNSGLYQSHFSELEGKRPPQVTEFHDKINSNMDTRERRETRRQTFFGQGDAITEELFSSNFSK